jgi:hypothetical protein
MMRTPMTVAIAACCGLAIYALAASSDSTHVHKPTQAEPAAAQPTGATVKAVNRIDNARWTATTLEAATAEVNKEVLEKGEPKSITGEVVDVSCYLQLGKRGEAHIDCGSKCIKSGEPVGLLEEDGDLYLLFAEEHHPRRDGLTDISKAFLPLLAKTVTVSGMEVEMKGYQALYVSAAELGAMKKAATKAKASATTSSTKTKSGY